MHRSASGIARVTRAFTALVTVWCLGCSGFDPLLDALLGGGRSGMACASDGSMGSMAHGDMAADDASDRSTPTLSATADAQRSFECGCGSCTAASPVHWAANSARPYLPALAVATPLEPESVSRTPLPPPPQLTA